MMVQDDAHTDGPPAKRARPTSTEDVVVERAGQGAAANRAGRGMLTLEEVRPRWSQVMSQCVSELA